MKDQSYKLKANQETHNIKIKLNIKQLLNLKKRYSIFLIWYYV